MACVIFDIPMTLVAACTEEATENIDTGCLSVITTCVNTIVTFVYVDAFVIYIFEAIFADAAVGTGVVDTGAVKASAVKRRQTTFVDILADTRNVHRPTGSTFANFRFKFAFDAESIFAANALIDTGNQVQASVIVNVAVVCVFTLTVVSAVSVDAFGVAVIATSVQTFNAFVNIEAAVVIAHNVDFETIVTKAVIGSGNKLIVVVCEFSLVIEILAMNTIIAATRTVCNAVVDVDAGELRCRVAFCVKYSFAAANTVIKGESGVTAENDNSVVVNFRFHIDANRSGIGTTIIKASISTLVNVDAADRSIEAIAFIASRAFAVIANCIGIVTNISLIIVKGVDAQVDTICFRNATVKTGAEVMSSDAFNVEPIDVLYYRIYTFTRLD